MAPGEEALHKNFEEKKLFRHQFIKFCTLNSLRSVPSKSLGF